MGTIFSKPADRGDSSFKNNANVNPSFEMSTLSFKTNFTVIPRSEMTSFSSVGMETNGSEHFSLNQKYTLTFEYEQLSRIQKNKLNAIFREIITKAEVDFNDQEIQDIQSAVSGMLDRIKRRINERGVFSISRIEPCGSMAEKTALWKYDPKYSKQQFIEFDFLAVLKAACNFEADCSECCNVRTPPVNLEKLEKYYCSFYNLDLTDREILTKCFIRETNYCLASCRCLEVAYQGQDHDTYTFLPASTCSENEQGCDKCTVDRDTGTLRVKTSVAIGAYRQRCSLIFVWTSKTKSLCTRHFWCLSETGTVDNLSIHIDFLPGLELFQSKQQGAGVSVCSSSGLVMNPKIDEYKHYCFLVPNSCVLCVGHEFKDKWRRSGCLAEIKTFVNEMSNKHRKCCKVLKHPICAFANSYHRKIAVLHHDSSCSDAGKDCAKCVFKVLDELQHAYNTTQLKSLHSQANLLKQSPNYSKDIRYLQAAFSSVSELDSVSSFLNKVDILFFEMQHRGIPFVAGEIRQLNRI